MLLVESLSLERERQKSIYLSAAVCLESRLQANSWGLDTHVTLEFVQNP